jgi:hypothetical protein
VSASQQAPCEAHGSPSPNAIPMWQTRARDLHPVVRWCLCAPRWQEAFEAGHAPRVVLRAIHEGALAYCALTDSQAVCDGLGVTSIQFFAAVLSSIFVDARR